MVEAVSEGLQVGVEAAGEVVDDVGAGLCRAGLDREAAAHDELAGGQCVAEHRFDVGGGAAWDGVARAAAAARVVGCRQVDRAVCAGRVFVEEHGARPLAYTWVVTA